MRRTLNPNFTNCNNCNNHIVESDIIEIYNDIMATPGDTILDKIIGYCELRKVDFQEIGDIISSNNEFRKMLYNDCVQNNIIRDDDMKTMMKQSEILNEW